MSNVFWNFGIFHNYRIFSLWILCKKTKNIPKHQFRDVFSFIALAESNFQFIILPLPAPAAAFWPGTACTFPRLPDESLPHFHRF